VMNKTPHSCGTNTRNREIMMRRNRGTAVSQSVYSPRETIPNPGVNSRELLEVEKPAAICSSYLTEPDFAKSYQLFPFGVYQENPFTFEPVAS
jgi:hypothetical protein